MEIITNYQVNIEYKTMTRTNGEFDRQDQFWEMILDQYHSTDKVKWSDRLTVHYDITNILERHHRFFSPVFVLDKKEHYKHTNLVPFSPE